MLDEVISDEKIIDDLRKIIWKEENNGYIELNENKIFVPENTPIFVTHKSVIKINYDIDFGNHFLAQLAIGKMNGLSTGIINAEYCFATLYYNMNGSLFKIDFHLDMR